MERAASSPGCPPDLLLLSLSGELQGHWERADPARELHIQLGGQGKEDPGPDPRAAQVMSPVEPGRRLSVEIAGVSAFVPRSFAPPSVLARLQGTKPAAEDDKRYRQVLFDVSGSVKPGEVLALMGPSGSGKTSLLSIIGSRAQKMMHVTGEVTFNGQPLDKRRKRQVGFVLQDDLLYEALTVHETLHYAAMLRLPRTMSREEKTERVEAVIGALGLDTCRDTIIGGFLRKGISGGERKRTSVGHELLINPSLLLLDEPTSGLDSTTAMHLLSVLRQLAAGGRCVISTLHQPSSRLYQQLDKLMLLSQGHVMYYGEAAAAVEFFDGLGYRLPYGINTADFLLDLASGDVAGGGRDGEASRLHLIRGSEAFLRQHPMEGFTAGKAPELRQAQLAGAWAPPSPSGGAASLSQPVAVRSSNAKSPALDSERPGASSKADVLDIETGAGAGGGAGAGAGVGPRWGAPYLTQISILLQRSVRTRRFEAFSTQLVVQTLAVALLAGLFWWQKASSDTLAAARNTLGLLFFELMYLSMRSMFVALFTFPAEHKMMLKERASGMYRLSAFYVAHMLSDLPMELALPTLFMAIVYWMGGLRATPGAFLGNYGVNLLTMLVSQGMGLLLGALVTNPKSAQALASVVTLTMVLTGGFFVLGLPGWVSWVRYTSYIYYALGILLFLEFDGRTLYSCVTPGGDGQSIPTDPASPETAPECTPVANVQESLGLLQDPNSQAEALRNAAVLLAWLVALRLAVYWVLRKKTRG